MPFLLPHDDDENQIFFIGKCRYATVKRQACYVIVSLRGYFTLNEAIPFLMHSKARGAVPFYGDYFTNNVSVSSMGMNIELPLAKKHKKIKYYIDHYGTPRLMSQYEWNIARHDVHQFVAPEERSQKVFGDYLTPAERIQAIRDNDLLQVISVTYRP